LQVGRPTVWVCRCVDGPQKELDLGVRRLVGARSELSRNWAGRYALNFLSESFGQRKRTPPIGQGFESGEIRTVLCAELEPKSHGCTRFP
jgi:hypothetical protein